MSLSPWHNPAFLTAENISYTWLEIPPAVDLHSSCGLRVMQMLSPAINCELVESSEYESEPITPPGESH